MRELQHITAIADLEAARGRLGVALLIVVGLGIHTALCGVGFLLHYYDAAGRSSGRSRAPVPPLRAYLRAWSREWWYGLAAALSYPFGWLPKLGEERFDPSGGPPVVLVHGYAMNRAIWFVTYWRLRRRGFRNVYLATLNPVFGRIEAIGERLGARLREISKLCGGQPLIGAGHSLGGLALRHCCQSEPDLPMRKLVCIGTPHGGTRMAALLPGEAATQLQYGSRFIKTLKAPRRVPVSCIISNLDNFVLPARSGALSGAASVHRFDACGHAALLYDEAAFEALVEELRVDDPQAPPTNQPTGDTA